MVSSHLNFKFFFLDVKEPQESTGTHSKLRMLVPPLSPPPHPPTSTATNSPTSPRSRARSSSPCAATARWHRRWRRSLRAAVAPHAAAVGADGRRGAEAIAGCVAARAAAAVGGRDRRRRRREARARLVAAPHKLPAFTAGLDRAALSALGAVRDVDSPLRELNVSNRLGDGGASALAGAATARAHGALRQLHAGANAVGDAGASLAGALGTGGVSALLLQENEIGDAGAAALAARSGRASAAPGAAGRPRSTCARTRSATPAATLIAAAHPRPTSASSRRGRRSTPR